MFLLSRFGWNVGSGNILCPLVTPFLTVWHNCIVWEYKCQINYFLFNGTNLEADNHLSCQTELCFESAAAEVSENPRMTPPPHYENQVLIAWNCTQMAIVQAHQKRGLFFLSIEIVSSLANVLGHGSDIFTCSVLKCRKCATASKSTHLFWSWFWSSIWHTSGTESITDFLSVQVCRGNWRKL